MNYPVVRIGDILELNYGKSLPSESRSGSGYTVYGSNGMTGLHEMAITGGPAIIVGRKGSIGEIHYSEEPCWPIDTTYYVDSFGDSVAPRWLYHRLQNVNLKALNKAVAIPGLNRNDIYQLEIPLPPLEEQRRIAAILDKADSLEKLSHSAVARLHQTLASSFRHLSSVTAPDCTSRKLEEVVEAIIDYRGKSPEKTAKGVPLITARLIKEGRILEATEFIAPESYSEWMRRGMPKRGDVVFTTEAPLGQVAQIDNPDVALAQRLVLLRGNPHELDNTYLRFALRMSSVAEQIRKRATGSTVLGIRQKELRQIEIPLPPLTAQKDFARLALAIEEKIRQMRQRGDITKALRHSLASRLMEE